MTQPVDPTRPPAPTYPPSPPPPAGTWPTASAPAPTGHHGWPQAPNGQPTNGQAPYGRAPGGPAYVGQAPPGQVPPGQASNGRPAPTGPDGPFATQPYEPPHEALPVPPSGRVEVKVNAVQAAVVSVLCLAAAGGFSYWRWYYGDLWDLSDGNGDVNKGTVLFHLIPLVLFIVAIIYLIRLLDRSAKLIFEAPGVQIHDKAAPDGYRKIGWGQVGRVMVTKTAAGRRTLEHWVVLDRHGAVLANVPAAGKAPSPDTGLAQLVTLTGGRIQIG